MSEKQDDKPGSGAFDPTKVKDPSEWPAILDKATKDKGFLKVDPKTLKTCAEQCKELISSMIGYREFIPKNQMNALTDISDEVGGIALTRIYNDKGTEIVNDIDRHIKLLIAMGETFYAAMKSYQEAEKDNSEDISKAASMREAKAPLDLKPPTYFPKPNGSGGEKAPAAAKANVEPPQVRPSMSYNRAGLYYFGKTLVGKDVMASTAGVQYTWVGGQLWSAIQSFEMTLKTATKDDVWRGTGKDAALAAVNRYTAQATKFASGISDFGKILLYTGEWIAATYAEMPASAEWTKCHPDAYLEGRREAYDKFYVKGIENSVKALPLLVDVASVPKPPPPAASNTPPANGQNPSSPSKPDTNGTGSGDGAGDPKTIQDAYNKGYADAAAGREPNPNSVLGTGVGLRPGEIRSGPGVNGGTPGSDPLKNAYDQGYTDKKAGKPANPNFGAGNPGAGTNGSEAPGGPTTDPYAGLRKMMDEYNNSGGPGPATNGRSQTTRRANVPGLPKIPEPGDGATMPGGGTGLPGGSGPRTPGAGNPGAGLPGSGSTPMPAAAQAAQLASSMGQGIDGIAKAVNSAVNAGGELAKAAMEGKIPGVPGVNGGGPGDPAANQSKLFPRAGLAPAGGEAVPSGRSATSPNGGMPGMGSPGGGAPASGGGQGGGTREHKRAKYLDSPVHLEEAFGALPDKVRPVIEP